ncbi:NAD(+)-dependent deacetylase, silent information regulator protein family protein [Reticulomyxa filosa]|uniref:NAD(+)-dependent deacetylase, silent information regulator protein family protein n=1 Tax=Reticulomyxa filosa TaxID=46433 RepID=X6NLC6_RETFI|nr:NAD(+)-dependent deacetylase, silent information regulator protein family protein [Reticulomyxa filosa]|eukprot:ETO27095.1 NAD(+)-dependent deacetylase, silent information regulator protein family protein [Reticulomyxa filosa]
MWNKVLYEVLADILNKRCKPTLTHCFLRLLQNKGKLRWLFTQNVDALERCVGINPSKLIECHGTFSTASCFKCKQEVSISLVRECVLKKQIPIHCPNCDSPLVKPDCVLFGEDLPAKYYQAAKKQIYDIDLLLVIGTSLSVKPVSNVLFIFQTSNILAILSISLLTPLKQYL